VEAQVLSKRLLTYSRLRSAIWKKISLLTSTYFNDEHKLKICLNTHKIMAKGSKPRGNLHWDLPLPFAVFIHSNRRQL